MKQQTKRSVAISLAIILVTAVVLMAICTDGFLNWNKYCLYGHDYGEDNKCVRCGKDKPIENEPEIEPQAFVSEPYSMRVASAKKLLATNSESTNDLMPISINEGAPISSDQIIDTDLNPSDFPLSSYATPYGGLVVNRCQPLKSEVVVYGSLHVGAKIVAGNTSPRLFYRNVGDVKWQYVSIETRDTYTHYLDLGSAFGRYEVVLVNTNLSERLSGVLTIDFRNNALPAAPTKTGYTFTGWYTDEACTNKYTDQYVTSDITLYAGFRAHTYNIKFNANSGSGTMANEPMTYDQSKALTANGFTKDHYAFKGWATSADGDVVYSNGQSVKNLTATDEAVIELFAIWERSEVSVTFVSEGNTVATTWIAIGTKATLPENPSKEGHTFNGWYYEDGTKYDTQNISEDITLTAKFDVIKCTVTFIVDGEVYATYVCDWGTSLAEALNANDVNPVLLQTEDEYSRNF